MEDSAIVALYWQRDEGAITASDEKYGGLCRSLSQNILDSWEDAAECAAVCARLVNQLELILEAEQPTLKNIL